MQDIMSSSAGFVYYSTGLVVAVMIFIWFRNNTTEANKNGSLFCSLVTIFFMIVLGALVSMITSFLLLLLPILLVAMLMLFDISRRFPIESTRH